MRIAHVAPYDPAGGNGVSRAVLNWARVLPDFQIEVEIWDFSSSVSKVVPLDTGFCRVFQLPCHSNRVLGIFSMPAVTREFLASRARHVDGLHLHSVFRPVNHWAARLGVPFVVSPHNGYHADLLRGRSRWKKWAATSLWERADLNRARAVFVLNTRESSDLYAYGARVKMVPLPNILEPDVFAEAEVARPLGRNWVYIGRLDVDIKGLDALLDGFGRFRRSRKGGTQRLVLAGTDFRGGLARLKRAAERFGVSADVDFPGPQFGPDKLELLHRTAVFLHPSRAEGLPYAVLEAMAYGRPVMVTPATNVAELVSARRAGWVVDSTAQSIAEAFEGIANTPPKEMERSARAARELILSEFEGHPIASRLASVYREILA